MVGKEVLLWRQAIERGCLGTIELAQIKLQAYIKGAVMVANQDDQRLRLSQRLGKELLLKMFSQASPACESKNVRGKTKMPH